MSQSLRLCAAVFAILVLGACGNANNASCASKLDTIRNQLQWDTPGVNISQAIKSKIQDAERELARDYEAGCLKAIEDLEDLPGIR